MSGEWPLNAWWNFSESSRRGTAVLSYKVVRLARQLFLDCNKWRGGGKGHGLRESKHLLVKQSGAPLLSHERKPVRVKL